jgi:hypothetical protein
MAQQEASGGAVPRRGSAARRCENMLVLPDVKSVNARFAGRVFGSVTQQQQASINHLKDDTMNKVLAVLIAGLFAGSAFAQAPATPSTAAPASTSKAVKADVKEVKSANKADAAEAKADAKKTGAITKDDAKNLTPTVKADAKEVKASAKEDKTMTKLDANEVKPVKAATKADAKEVKEVKMTTKADAKNAAPTHTDAHPAAVKPMAKAETKEAAVK